MLASTIPLFDGPDWNAQPAAEYTCPAGHKRTVIFLRGYRRIRRLSPEYCTACHAVTTWTKTRNVRD
jgi:hypothetical protein